MPSLFQTVVYCLVSHPALQKAATKWWLGPPHRETRRFVDRDGVLNIPE